MGPLITLNNGLSLFFSQKPYPAKIILNFLISAGYKFILSEMRHPTIIGRLPELKLLEQICESPQADFIAIYGRRRIGKTFLISEFFKDKGLYFEVTGSKNGSLTEQLFHFGYEFGRCFNTQAPLLTSWAQAFHCLHEAIEKTDSTQKIILFLMNFLGLQAENQVS